MLTFCMAVPITTTAGEDGVGTGLLPNWDFTIAEMIDEGKYKLGLPNWDLTIAQMQDEEPY